MGCGNSKNKQEEKKRKKERRKRKQREKEAKKPKKEKIQMEQIALADREFEAELPPPAVASQHLHPPPPQPSPPPAQPHVQMELYQQPLQYLIDPYYHQHHPQWQELYQQQQIEQQQSSVQPSPQWEQVSPPSPYLQSQQVPSPSLYQSTSPYPESQQVQPSLYYQPDSSVSANESFLHELSKFKATMANIPTDDRLKSILLSHVRSSSGRSKKQSESDSLMHANSTESEVNLSAASSRNSMIPSNKSSLEITIDESTSNKGAKKYVLQYAPPEISKPTKAKALEPQVDFSKKEPKSCSTGKSDTRQSITQTSPNISKVSRKNDHNKKLDMLMCQLSQLNQQVTNMRESRNSKSESKSACSHVPTGTHNVSNQKLTKTKLVSSSNESAVDESSIDNEEEQSDNNSTKQSDNREDAT